MTRSIPATSALLTSLLVLGLAACGDDPASGDSTDTAGERADSGSLNLDENGAASGGDSDSDGGDSDAGETGETGDSGDSGSPDDTGGDDADPGEEPDLGPLALCIEHANAACPGSDDSGLVRHQGLVPWAPCRFELADQGSWASRDLLLDQLGESIPELPVSELTFNHLGPAVGAEQSKLAKVEHLDRAFRWQDGDFADGRWMPQGLSGTYDAYDNGKVDGRELVAVSWYHNAKVSDLGLPNEVVRVSFADVTALGGGGDVPYRHVLLVEPFAENGEVNLRAPRLHAGGIAWVGRYLYVADTAKGLRVFDTARIFEVSTDKPGSIGLDAKTGDYHAYGYRYVLPEVSAYFLSGDSCWVRSSYVGVDRTSTPPSLVTGEFHDTDIAGKLIRWSLDGQRLATSDADTGTTLAREAFFAQESDVQGAVAIDGEWWLSSSAQSGADGALYRTSEGRESARYGWVVGPEDLMFAGQQRLLWSLNEFAGQRFVFAVDVDAYGAL